MLGNSSVGGRLFVDRSNSTACSPTISENKSDKNPISALATRALAWLKKQWESLKSLAFWVWSYFKPSPEQSLVRELFQGMGKHYEGSMVALIHTIPVDERPAFVKGVKSLVEGISEEATSESIRSILRTLSFSGLTERTRGEKVRAGAIPSLMSFTDLKEMQESRRDVGGFNGRGYITSVVAKDFAKIPYEGREEFVQMIQPLIEGVTSGVDRLRFIEKVESKRIADAAKSLFNPSMTPSEKLKLIDWIDRFLDVPAKNGKLDLAVEVAKPLADTGKINDYVGSLLYSCANFRAGRGQYLADAIIPLLPHYSHGRREPISYVIDQLAKLRTVLWLPFTQAVIPIIKGETGNYDVGEVLRAFAEMKFADWATVSEAAAPLISRRHLTYEQSFGLYAYEVIQIVKDKPADERKAFSDRMVPLIQDVKSAVDLLKILNEV